MAIIEDPTFATSKFQRRKKETMAERGFKEIITENFSNVVKDISLQIQEAEPIPNMINPKKPMPRHITIKLLKMKKKEQNLESCQRKTTHHQDTDNKLMRAGFSSPGNHGYQKAVGYFLRTEGKGLLMHNFYIWQNYPSG